MIYMIIGGLQKITLIDYPGKIATTVFLANCNFRCPWCYSGELVLPEKIKKQPKILKKDFFSFLKTRTGLLEGVVVCGGEPTVNKDLPEFVQEIKKLGYSVKLDTNGSNPKMLKNLIDKKLIDYIAMDVKAPKEKYEKVIGRKVNVRDIEKSVSILLALPGQFEEKEAGYEFRTTMVPGLVEKKDVLKIARWLSGAEKYYLQNFRPEKNIDSKFEKVKPYSDEYILDTVKAVSPFFTVCQMRS